MNNQILFVSVIVLSVSVAFLFYQNIKLSRKLDDQYKSVNKNMTDLSHMIALNNNITVSGGSPPHPEEVQMMDAPGVGEILTEGEVGLENSNLSLEPQVTEEFAQEINQLKNEYQDYELSSELKNEIDNLERMENIDTLPEQLVLSRENLEELQNSQLEEDVDLDNRIVDFNEEQLRNDEGEGEAEGEGESEGEGGDEVEAEAELNTEQGADFLQEENENDSEIQEVSLETNFSETLNLPDSISLDSENIREEVSLGVNELVGNIIASASDVEIIPEKDKIKLSNDGDDITVRINNEERALEDLNGTELKDVCKEFNLKAKGKKIELVERIRDYQINLKNSKNFFVLN